MIELFSMFLIIAVGVCAPSHQMREALLNGGYRAIWNGASDKDVAPVTLWETPTRHWAIVSVDPKAKACVLDVGFDSYVEKPHQP